MADALKPLATVAQLAITRGGDIADDDPAAALALAGASGFIRSYTGQDFDVVSGDEITLNGTGSDSLLLPQLPVTEVSAVTITCPGSTDQDLEEAEWYLDAYGMLWRTRSRCWPRGHGNIAITYDHGFKTVPPDLNMVAISLASRLYDLGTSGGRDVTESQEGIGTYSSDIRYVASVNDLTPTELAVLSTYQVIGGGPAMAQL